MNKEKERTESEIIDNGRAKISENGKGLIERLSILILLFLIASILLLSFDLKLISGSLILIACSLGVVVTRKAIHLLSQAREFIREVSTSNEKKDDVITNFSHKIREPLNNIVVVGELLLESAQDKKQKELLETLVASTNNMVNTLDELTMQTAENIIYESRQKIRFNLLSTIQNTIDLFSHKDSANIDFIINKKDTGDIEVLGDPIILKQILLDIFNNIEDQSLGTLTMVTFTITKTAENQHECSVKFGIQTSRKLNIINESELPGSLAAKLIRSNGGRYNQEIGENHTIVEFELKFLNPAKELRQPIASPKIEELKQKEKIHRELKDANILLVEDNSINQKITLLTLKPLVKNIDTAANGKEALDKFGSSSYDLILMDIQMPVMTGHLAAEKIRALEASTNAHIPIIAITANAMLGDKERCLSAGMDDYISKPFQPAFLIEKIKKFL